MARIEMLEKNGGSAWIYSWYFPKLFAGHLMAPFKGELRASRKFDYLNYANGRRIKIIFANLSPPAKTQCARLIYFIRVFVTGNRRAFKLHFYGPPEGFPGNARNILFATSQSLNEKLHVKILNRLLLPRVISSMNYAPLIFYHLALINNASLD